MSLSMQREIIEALGVRPEIESVAEVRKRVDFLKAYLLESNARGLLIGISGGVDSAVAAALCKKATDELAVQEGRGYMTLGVFQPYAEQEDIEDSYTVAEALGLEHTVETNIGDAVDEIALETEYALKALGQHRHLSHQGKGNVKARMRMTVQYALAFENHLLVVGTDHASEAIAGFYTKWGDGAVDIAPLRTLTKRQVRQLADYLGVPASIIGKVPTAGLWPGQEDETELGVSYEDNSDYLEGRAVKPEISQRLENHYRRTVHKRSAIPGI